MPRATVKEIVAGRLAAEKNTSHCSVAEVVEIGSSYHQRLSYPLRVTIESRNYYILPEKELLDQIIRASDFNTVVSAEGRSSFIETAAMDPYSLASYQASVQPMLKEERSVPPKPKKQKPPTPPPPPPFSLIAGTGAAPSIAVNQAQLDTSRGVSSQQNNARGV